MSLLYLPSAPATRVSLLDESGTPVVRWTLQSVSREGREARWTPEGSLRQLGSGAGNLRRWVHRGFRVELALRWSYGMQSIREAFVGGAWAAPEELPTALAHGEILEWSTGGDLQVEPFVGSTWSSFIARAFEQGVSLQDTKGVAHPSLELDLVGVKLVQGVTFSAALLGWGIGPWSFLPWGD